MVSAAVPPPVMKIVAVTVAVKELPRPVADAVTTPSWDEMLDVPAGADPKFLLAGALIETAAAAGAADATSPIAVTRARMAIRRNRMTRDCQA